MKEVFIKERILKQKNQNECITIDIDEMKSWNLGDKVAITALDKRNILRTGLFVLGELVAMKNITEKDAVYPKARYQFKILGDCSKF